MRIDEHLGLPTLHDRHTRVGGAEVDSDDFAAVFAVSVGHVVLRLGEYMSLLAVIALQGSNQSVRDILGAVMLPAPSLTHSDLKGPREFGRAQKQSRCQL